jgi:uncharacterized protein
MARAAESQEKSMEEILASIRRVIAEDESEKLGQRPVKAASVEVKADVAAASAEQRPVKAASVEVKADVTAASAEPERATGDSRSPPPQESPAAGNVRPGTAKAAHSSTILDLTDPMASSASGSVAPVIDSGLAPTPPPPIDHVASNKALSVTQSRGTHDERRGLMSSATIAAVDSAFNALAETVLVHNARTLDDMVREMLRPILKFWLEDNLPGIVERLVRTEIDRVSRGRGGWGVHLATGEIALAFLPLAVAGSGGSLSARARKPAFPDGFLNGNDIACWHKAEVLHVWYFNTNELAMLLFR